MSKTKGAGRLRAKASGADLQIAFGGVSFCQEYKYVLQLLQLIVIHFQHFQLCSTSFCYRFHKSIPGLRLIVEKPRSTFRFRVLVFCHGGKALHSCPGLCEAELSFILRERFCQCRFLQGPGFAAVGIIRSSNSWNLSTI